MSEEERSGEAGSDEELRSGNSEGDGHLGKRGTDEGRFGSGGDACGLDGKSGKGPKEVQRRRRGTAKRVKDEWGKVIAKDSGERLVFGIFLFLTVEQSEIGLLGATNDVRRKARGDDGDIDEVRKAGSEKSTVGAQIGRKMRE